jgi:hypothetical protein
LIRISTKYSDLKNKIDIVGRFSKRKKTMTSIITKENYDKMMKNNIISEIRNGVKVLVKADFRIQNFYIQNRKGNVSIWKIPETITFKFRWTPSNPSSYIDKCCDEDSENNVFMFESFEEFDRELKKQYICKYHVSCGKNCSADYLISPEEKCSICLNDIQLHLLEETKCGHKFCLSCLDTYVQSKREKEITCPTCRRNLKWCYGCDNSKFQCDCGDDE